MAENWADLTAMEGQDDINDPAPLEADASIDKIEDTAKPRRNRIPTVNDDLIDEGNTDDAPRPKRGRGRPKKDEETIRDIQLVNPLRKELEELKSENSKLEDLLKIYTERNEDIEKDLELTRNSLMEKEQDYLDLLDQFSCHEENNLDTQTSKPMGVVYFDEISEKLTNKLPSSIKWKCIKRNLSDIDETDQLEFKEADVVVLLSGANEIANGVSACQLHQALKQKLSLIGEHCVVYSTSLPPNNKSRVQTDLYNHKFGNMSGDGQNINLIKLKFLGSKLDMVNFDGHTPSDKCVILYEKAFKQITPPASIKKNTTGKTPDNADFNVTAVLPIKSEHVGRIIGKGGNVIKRITVECEVRMSFGNWKERTSEAREDVPEAFTGVMIKGCAKNVKKAIDWVNEIIEAGRAK